jgi:hypothetical protein
VPFTEAVENPRFFGDARNAVDYSFGGGASMPDDFWLYLRPLLAERPGQLSSILRGEKVVTSTDRLKPDEAEQLSKAINAKESPTRGRLTASHLSGITTLVVHENTESPMPLNKIAAGVSGFDGKGNFRTLLISKGRDSVGANIPQIAEMGSQFMDIVVLGPAGGDVTAVDNKGEILWIPSTKGGITRPHPSQLVLSNLAA